MYDFRLRYTKYDLVVAGSYFVRLGMMEGVDRVVRRLVFRWRLLWRPLSPYVVDTKVADRLFQLLDFVFFFDAYEGISNALSPRLRKLTPREIALLQPIFGGSVPYQAVRLDERARYGPRRYRFCYVSFRTINSWGPIDEAILVHEMVHIWQYQQFGACYIPRALAAQRTSAGYDYGGLAGLRNSDYLTDFNYEQMASVVEDAFRLRRGLPPRYVAPSADPAAYGALVGQLRQGKWV